VPVADWMLIAECRLCAEAGESLDSKLRVAAASTVDVEGGDLHP